MNKITLSILGLNKSNSVCACLIIKLCVIVYHFVRFTKNIKRKKYQNSVSFMHKIPGKLTKNLYTYIESIHQDGYKLTIQSSAFIIFQWPQLFCKVDGTTNLVRQIRVKWSFIGPTPFLALHNVWRNLGTLPLKKCSFNLGIFRTMSNPSPFPQDFWRFWGTFP